MRKKVGLFTLGILLILCGTAIILAQYTNYKLFQDIFLLWPAFLILLGLEFILTKLWYDFRKQDVQLSPSGISIFLAIIILFTSSLWVGPGFNFPSLNLNFNNSNWAEMFSDAVEETVSMDAGLSNMQKVIINNVRGSVEVQPSDGDNVHLEAKIRINTNNKAEASALVKDVITLNNGIITSITSTNPGSNRDHSLQYVNMTVFVPRKAELEISTGFGRILVKDMENNVSIRQQHSDIDLENIKGNAEIDSSFADIQVAALDGNLDISNSHAKVKVEDITGSAKIENSFDTTEVQNVSRDLSVKSQHGQVRASNIQGNASIENEYDSTSCSNVDGDLDIWAQHSAVSLGNIKGNIDAETSYDDISLENSSYANADIKANTSYSSIHGDDDINLDIKDEKNLQEAYAVNGNGRQKIRLKNQYGDIRIDLN
jgi:hypothetical protein